MLVVLMIGTENKDRRGLFNRIIWKIFTKKHGITLKQDAVDFLMTKLGSSEETSMEEIEQTVDFVASMYIKQESKNKSSPYY